MKKLIIAFTVILCIMTLTACSDSPLMGGGDPEVGVYVNIIRNDGEYFDDYDRPAPEARKIKSWLEALELRSAEVPDKFDGIWYELTFKRMTVLGNVTELSVYTSGGEQYLEIGGELYLVKDPSELPEEITAYS